LWHKLLEALGTRALKRCAKMLFQTGKPCWTGRRPCYVLVMKTKIKHQESTFTGPLLADVLLLDKANTKANFESPSVGSTPLLQSALYQDPGSGYNQNFTFPQD